MAYTQLQIEQRIAEISATIESGVDSVTTDGTSTRVNFAELRRERDRLERQLRSTKARRPAAARIYLGHG